VALFLPHTVCDILLPTLDYRVRGDKQVADIVRNNKGEVEGDGVQKLETRLCLLATPR